MTNSYTAGANVMQVYVRAGERIQLGQVLTGRGTGNIKAWAPGADPLGAAPVLDCAADQPGRGVIASLAQEQAGPRPSVGGYHAV